MIGISISIVSPNPLGDGPILVPSGRILLEDGDGLLLEDDSNFITE